MTDKEFYQQAVLSALQGILEGKGGFVGEAFTTLLARDAFRIADALMAEYKYREENQETLWQKK